VGGTTNLREGTIVPQVTLVGEAIANKSKLAFFDVLLDWVENLFLGDLITKAITVSKVGL
jgi:hypothetical protein